MVSRDGMGCRMKGFSLSFGILFADERLLDVSGRVKMPSPALLQPGLHYGIVLITEVITPILSGKISKDLLKYHSAGSNGVYAVAKTLPAILRVDRLLHPPSPTLYTRSRDYPLP